MVVGCYRKVCLNGWILHLIFTHCSSVPLLSVRRTMCSFNPLSFTNELTHPSSTWLFSYIVKVCALAACSSPGTVCLYWISCYAQDKMAYHLHLILCTSDAVTTCTPVTLFFPLGVQLCSKKKKKKHEQRVTAFKSCKWV